MIRKYMRNVGLFAAVWLGIMVIYAFAEKVNSFAYLWKLFLIPALFLGCIAALATLLEHIFPVRNGINWIFLGVALALDQLIKAYFFSIEWETFSMALIEPVFYIEPTHNTRGSYLWVLLKIDRVPHFLNIVLFILVGVVFVEVWRFYVRRKRNSFWINGFIHFFLAGLLANLADNAFRGGSLDYVTIKPLYTFDLKDLYITLCELFLITELLDNRLLRRMIKMPGKESRKLQSDFILFVKRDLRLSKRKEEE